jgi:hypothetical protein
MVRALTEADPIAQWMSGARLESNWERCAGIVVTGKLQSIRIETAARCLRFKPGNF